MRILKRIAATLGLRRSESPEEYPSEDVPSNRSELDLTTKPEQVIEMLDRNGGRMRQSDIVSSADWSSATVSRVLSEMDEDGTVRKIRIGRENVISLIGSEPDWYTPPQAPPAEVRSPDDDEEICEKPILLVEDNEQDEQLLKEAFVEAGISRPIHSVRDGSSAVEFLLQRDRFTDVARPALVLLDLQLIMIDGFDVLAELNSHDHLRGIPLLILSHSDDPKNVQRAYEEGATAYLTKPKDFEDLLALVKSIDSFWLSHAIQPGFAGQTLPQ